MKGLIWIIVLFAAAVGLTIVAQHYSGNVYIVIDQTQTQIAVNLHLFVGAMIVFVVLLYLLLRLINGIINIPGRVRRFGRSRQAHHAETALNKAGLAYFEGKFQHAEQEAAKVLENKEAGHNRTLALMLAVHSADQMGDDAKREGYLKEIAQLPHKAQLSRHLLEAESALNRQDYPAAEAALAAAAAINPKLTRLVRLQLRYMFEQNNPLEVLDRVAKLEKAPSTPPKPPNTASGPGASSSPSPPTIPPSKPASAAFPKKCRKANSAPRLPKKCCKSASIPAW